MILIGLTGSIGMGKSTALKMFTDLGAAAWDADAAVHRMYRAGGAAVDPIEKAFPGTVVDGEVDRARLAQAALKDADALQKLEAIVHPLVAEDRGAFMAAARASGAQAAVFDVPLLFENKSENEFDAVVVVSAPADVQRKRVLARSGMSDQKLDAILMNQMPDADKRARADYVLSSDQPLEDMQIEAAKIYAAILEKGPKARE